MSVLLHLLVLLLLGTPPPATGLLRPRSPRSVFHYPRSQGTSAAAAAAPSAATATAEARIRLATLDDLGDLSVLLEGCGMAALNQSPAAAQQVAAAIDDEMFLVAVEEGKRSTAGAVAGGASDGKLLGTVCFEVIREPGSPCDRYAYISHLAIDGAVRRRGLARRLLAEAVVQSAAGLGCCGRCCLLVDRANAAAMAFYSSLPGFTIGAGSAEESAEGEMGGDVALATQQEQWLRLNICGAQQVEQESARRESASAVGEDADTKSEPLVLVTGVLWPLPRDFSL
jgi:ribosomal protein S18 acetylase RimI-like enzyme